MTESQKGAFPETRMSLIGKIREGNDATKREALQRFVEGYRPALVSFLVKCKQVSESDADDLVQDFILNKIMNGKVLELANGQGRFRNALRVCLQRYLVDSIRKKKREPMAGDLEGEHADVASSDESNTSLDQLWAIAIFREALSRMKTESQHWDLFFDRVLTQPPLPYDEVIKKHGYTNPTKASNFLMTAKRTFNRIMLDCVAGQSELLDEQDEEELEREIEFLRQQLLDSNMVQAIAQTINSESEINLEDSRGTGAGSISDQGVVFVETAPDASWSREDTHHMLVHLLSQPVTEILGLDLTDLMQNLQSLIGPETPSPENDSLVQQLEALFRGQAAPESVAISDDLNRSISNSIGFELMGVFGALASLLQSDDRSDENLALLFELKEHFNRKGKSSVDELPASVTVTMTFAIIAKYVESGGSVENVTSMRRDVLISRLEKLADKTWVPGEITRVIKLAVTTLLG